jgi:hypothetical protein
MIPGHWRANNLLEIDQAVVKENSKRHICKKNCILKIRAMAVVNNESF